MATSRGQTPPVNLKERIAALQQRSVSPNTHQSAQAAPRGLPSPGSGGLRDKIAKFEEKGGTPVPRGSIGMGAPQLAENAPPRKHGELYGNRVPGLGRPSGVPVGSRSGSPLPLSASADEVPGPRKRCISTGTPLSSSPSSFLTDEPVPALPNGPSGGVARRNSVAVNFSSGRRVMSESDADIRAGDASSLSLASLAPGKPPDAQPPNPESVVEMTPVEVQQLQPSSLKAAEVTASPADTGKTKVDTPGDPPASKDSPSSLYPASQNVSQSPSVKSSKDGLSDCEATRQKPFSPSPLKTASSTPSVPSDTPPAAPKSVPAHTKTVVSLSTPPSEKAKKQVAASRDSVPTTISTSSQPVPPSPTFPISNPTTEPRLQSKPTFKAVVHRKVTEQPSPPAASGLAPPEPPQSTKQRRGADNINTIEVPPSPGVGDLAVLLEDAAMLEWRLTDGGDKTGLKAKELLDATPTSATFQPDPRQTSASTLTEHAPAPSVDSGSQSARSVSIPSIREPLVGGEIPEGEETDGRSLASTTFSQRSPTSRKYLSNIYRLTSRRSSSSMPGTYPRDSMSLSSEDSSPVTTPSSDNGKRKGFGIAWPGASPKKGGPNVSRSSSFADKIFNRSRTSSNVSRADQVSERSSLYLSSQPSLTLTFPSETHSNGVDIGARPTSWISPVDSNSEFSPASSLLDKDLFDAFPSVPQTLPPGFHLDAENTGVGRASTLPVNGRKQVNQRLSMA